MCAEELVEEGRINEIRGNGNTVIVKGNLVCYGFEVTITETDKLCVELLDVSFSLF